jgi:hypothetical protein
MKETEQYTYEKFKEDFEDAQTPEAKGEAIFTLLDSDIDVKEYKEDIQEYRVQLQDLKNQMEAEEDASIRAGIESGAFKLYTCIEDVDQYKAGINYYVKVDPIKERYTSSLVGLGSEYEVPIKIQEYVAGLKDLVWIVTDEGIGTLKKKNLVAGNAFEYFDFSRHFAIFA